MNVENADPGTPTSPTPPPTHQAFWDKPHGNLRDHYALCKQDNLKSLTWMLDP